MAYREHFSTLLRELRTNKKINPVESKFNLAKPLSKDKIQELAARFEIKLPTAVINFYAELNGVSAEWYVPKDPSTAIPRQIWGTFNLLDLETMLGGKPSAPQWKDVLWFDSMDAATRKKHQQLRPFDFFNSDEAECACFVIEKGQFNKTLVLHSLQDGIKPLKFDFTDYLDTLLKTRGYYGWQTSKKMDEKLVEIFGEAE